MILRKTSIFTGREADMEFPDGIEARIAYWQKSGTNIQDVFPDLSPEQREFLLSGSTPQEWDELFQEEADDFQGKDE